MITTRDQLINALANNRSRIVMDKASIASQAAGTYVSMWRATGQPGQGAIPSTAATCNHNTTGGIPFTQQVSPATSYIAWLCSTSSNAAMTMELHDRLAHMGGLSGKHICRCGFCVCCRFCRTYSNLCCVIFYI